LQLVLVGQPELRDVIRRPDLTQFAQRISAAFHMEPMDSPTVRAYIRHRLAVAGAKENIFSTSACDLIHDNTGGVPRLVNQLCDTALVYGFAIKQSTVDADLIREVLEDRNAAGSLPLFEPAAGAVRA